MKKFLFLSVVGAIALAMTFVFVSCGEKKATQNTEEPIAGTDYTLVTTPQGAKGIKKGEVFVIEPSVEYTAIDVVGSMFIAQSATGQVLLDPGTGHQRIASDTIIWKDTYFEGKRGEAFVVYIPEYKVQFAAKEYDIKGVYAISLFGDKISFWKEGQALIEPNNEYNKIAVLPDGKLLVLDGTTWGTATVTPDKLIQPGKTVVPKELKKYQAMKGWSDTASVMILE